MAPREWAGVTLDVSRWATASRRGGKKNVSAGPTIFAITEPNPDGDWRLRGPTGSIWARFGCGQTWRRPRRLVFNILVVMASWPNPMHGVLPNKAPPPSLT